MRPSQFPLWNAVIVHAMAQVISFSTGHCMRQHIIVTALVALAVSSCQKKASGQTVAVVNGDEITASELNSELTNEQTAAAGDTKLARNTALQNLINRKLLVQQAKSDG